MARYGLCIDLSRCIGCYSCVVGCKNWNCIEAGEKGRIDIMDLFEGDYPRVDRWILPILCMQCDHPPCVAVCRYGASAQTEEGVVFVDPEKCTGCELCTFACPYGPRVMREEKEAASLTAAIFAWKESERAGCPIALNPAPWTPWSSGTWTTGEAIFEGL